MPSSWPELAEAQEEGGRTIFWVTLLASPVGFLYNTVMIALTVNIAAGLL